MAAETAEVIFGAQQTISGAKEFYADVKQRMHAYGRKPEDLKVMPGLLVCVAETHEAAVKKYEYLQDLIDPITGLQLLSKRLDYDVSGFPIDGPLPDIPRNKTSSTRVDLFIEIARRENLTIKDLYLRVAGARGHYEIIGSPIEVADLMEEWVADGACDGFNIMPPVFPSSLHDFIDLVIPELQRRGIYRTAYDGNTLRENLGLTRPSWPTKRIN